MFGWVLLPVVLLLAGLWLVQRRLVYFPAAAPVASIAELVPGAEDARFATADGLELEGWFLPASGRTELRPPGLLLFEGNAGNRAHRLPLAQELTRRGLAVLLVDYRGYGGNPGTPTEAGLTLDALAAQAWLAARPDVDPERIVYFGESLGSGVALALAAERPPWALVLRSPFTSLVAVAGVHYPWLPVGLLMRDRFPSIERIRGLDCPLLVIAGQTVGVVPHSQSRELFEAAPMRAKKFVSIPDVGHNDPRLTAGAGMLDEIARFLSDETARGDHR